MSLHEYDLIYPLKNVKSTLVPITKELSLVISGIVKMCLQCLFECIKMSTLPPCSQMPWHLGRNNKLQGRLKIDPTVSFQTAFLC